ncbi:MAG: FAD/NAD(P)-binding protein [Planctomycetota bacterium]
MDVTSVRDVTRESKPSRVGQGDNPWRQRPVVLSRVGHETADVATYRFVHAGGEPAPFQGRPGQFNMLYVPGVGEAAISISGDTTDQSQAVHTIRHVGNVTGSIAQLDVGDSIGLRGPFGSGWPIDPCVGDDIILVAGGIGLAPLRPVVYELIRRRNAFGRITVLIGSRTPQDLLYPSEYASWSQADINVEATVDRAESDWAGDIGVVTLLLDRLELNRPLETTLMTCGPEVMMAYAIQAALQRGLSRSKLWMSMERHMNCAIGNCGHCQYGPHFVCTQGPVMRYDRVETLLKVDAL